MVRQLVSLRILAAIALIIIMGCGQEDDTQPPEVSITYPLNGSVIGDTVTIRVEANDNEVISRIEFYVDYIHWANGDDSSEPFEYIFNGSSLEIGNTHTLFAKAYDDAENVASSDTIEFYYQWVLFLEDDNEPFPRDLSKVYVRSTSATLEFRVETNGNWTDPHLLDDTGEPIDCAIFLDTDQNPATGLDPTDTTSYTIGDIGPDYVGVIGLEGDSLWSWSGSIEERWIKLTDFDYLNLQNNTNHFEVGIRLTDIGSPSIVDIVVANITFEPGSINWDFVPNEGEGHATYEMDRMYLGKSVKLLARSSVIRQTVHNEKLLYSRMK